MRVTCIIIAVLLTGSSLFASDVLQQPAFFATCQNCHAVMMEGQHRTAPPLKGVVGREVASVAGFNYSEKLKAIEGVWTKILLDEFLEHPNHAQSGTKMYFRGIKDPIKRALLIDWLANADVPSVVPPNDIRLPRTGIDYVKHANRLFHPCTACHTYTQGAPAQIGPNLFGVVGRPVASFPGFDYSEELNGRGGIWDEENLHAFFTEPKMFKKGSHMAFQTLKLKGDRTLIISLLKALKSP